MGLACKLLQKGYEVKGFLEHVWFIAEQASLNRFRPESILAYDQGVRDKASSYGLDAFGYGDADNFYRYFGAAALKREGKVKSVPTARYSEGKSKTSDIKELRICGLYNHGQCQYGSSCFRKRVFCLSATPPSIRLSKFGVGLKRSEMTHSDDYLVPLDIDYLLYVHETNQSRWECYGSVWTAF